MFNSELLLFLTVAELLDVDRVIESGRYRGYSTQILAEYFTDSGPSVVSINLRQGTEADRIARERLSGMTTELKYGDSRETLPEELVDSSAVLIDGPKGDAALELALELLDREKTALVAVHDLASDTFHRDVSELLFTKTLYSDNEKYVDAFRHLDGPCWDCDSISWEKPHVHAGQTVGSYGPTLGLFFDGEDPVDSRVESNYRSYLEHVRSTPSTRQRVGRFLRRKRRKGGPITGPLAGITLSLGKQLVR
jgi:hypothetical protein